MYSMERYMKTLKDYMRTFSRPEGRMAEGYSMEETLGFCTEYMSHLTATKKRFWDQDEDQSMIDEVLEEKSIQRLLNEDRKKWMHNFVLENAAHLRPWQRYSTVTYT
jgi:hypothetical protein